LNSYDNEQSTNNEQGTNNEVAEERECIDCDSPFTTTQGEVSYFVQHGLVAPKRCKPCRAIRKTAYSTNTAFPYNEAPKPPPSVPARVSITCAHCGRDADVPFTPIPDVKVYCKVCWVGIKNIGVPIIYNSPSYPSD